MEEVEEVAAAIAAAPSVVLGVEDNSRNQKVERSMETVLSPTLRRIRICRNKVVPAMPVAPAMLVVPVVRVVIPVVLVVPVTRIHPTVRRVLVLAVAFRQVSVRRR